MNLERSHSCPAVAINKLFLLASQSCILGFGLDHDRKPRRSQEQDEEKLFIVTKPQKKEREKLAKVAEVKNFEGYRELEDKETLNDLAIIKVKSGKTFLHPICLPKQSVRNPVKKFFS